LINSLYSVLISTAGQLKVWDQPHSEADYPGEVLAWIDAICGEKSPSKAALDYSAP
jgi:hypothetical protein